MPKHKQQSLASIHVHFNIARDAGVPDGPIQPGESLQAIERFVRWHERQAALGRELLVSLQKQAAHAAAESGAA